YMKDVMFDPQTSGGLLIAVSPAKADSLLTRLHEAGLTEAAIIGEVVGQPEAKIVLE
ncbi:MAG: selenide, water dikinase SelD, partial [Chloroflexi bacterium]